MLWKILQWSYYSSVNSDFSREMKFTKNSLIPKSVTKNKIIIIKKSSRLLHLSNWGWFSSWENLRGFRWGQCVLNSILSLYTCLFPLLFIASLEFNSDQANSKFIICYHILPNLNGYVSIPYFYCIQWIKFIYCLNVFTFSTVLESMNKSIEMREQIWVSWSLNFLPSLT